MYSVYKGYQPGIYNSWDECKKQINGYSGAKFKKFDNILDAKKFLKHGEVNVSHIDKYIKVNEPESDTISSKFCNFLSAFFLNISSLEVNAFRKRPNEDLPDP